MRHRRIAAALWLAFAFVTWNVAFDRGVADAAHSFTREQIKRYEDGAAVVPIEIGFTPQLWPAALRATIYAGAVLLCGAVVIGRSRP
jgi:hypothetical protein